MSMKEDARDDKRPAIIYLFKRNHSLVQGHLKPPTFFFSNISFYYLNAAVPFQMASVGVAFNELQQGITIILASLIYISHIY